MIDREVFGVLRSRAISKLSPDLAKESYGYHIDVVGDWEEVYNTDELSSYLGIHKTHAAKFSELSFHIGEFSESDRAQVRFHHESVLNAEKVINTTGKLDSVRWDLLELLADWRHLRRFASGITKVLDFGAGCGRQAIGAYANLPKDKNLHYIALDASTNGYTTQNAMFGALSVRNSDIQFLDLLDFEASGIPYPAFEKQNARVKITHFPAWTTTEYIPSRSMDLVMACHVHNEISGADFDRLMFLVEHKLADEGIFYVRSELGIWADTNYFDSVTLHAKDMIKRLDACDIRPIHISYFGGFQTTIFARKASAICKDELSKQSQVGRGWTGLQLGNLFSRNKSLTEVADHHRCRTRKALKEIADFRDSAFFAAQQYMVDETVRLVEQFGELDILAEGFGDYDDFAYAAAKADSSIKLSTDREKFFSGLTPATMCVAISGQKFWEVERILREKGFEFSTRLQYTYPVVFLAKKDFSIADPHLI